jgi:hypothetical protein
MASCPRGAHGMKACLRNGGTFALQAQACHIRVNSCVASADDLAAWLYSSFTEQRSGAPRPECTCSPAGKSTTMTAVRSGILSTALIGAATAIPAMRRSALLSAVATGSHRRQRAEAVAAGLDIAMAHGPSGDLLDAPDIDTV